MQMRKKRKENRYQLSSIATLQELLLMINFTGFKINLDQLQ